MREQCSAKAPFPRRTLLVGLAMLFIAGPALAQSKPRVWIASGQTGGTYRNIYANNLEKRLRSFDVYHRKTTGSGENLELLAAGKADIAFVQADVFAARRKADPERFDSLRVLGKLGDECIFIAHRKKGPPQTLDDLTRPIEGRDPQVAIGPREGGMASSWNYLVSLDPGLAGAKKVFDGDVLALNQLAAGRFDAVAWVTDPSNFKHVLLKAVGGNPDLQLMDLTSSEMSPTLPDGTRVYTRRKVKAVDKWNARKVSTLCTTALVMAPAAANEELVTRVADLVALDRDLLVPKR
jgi:TRAP-type uncharacterized transport system substrate-binding protein